MAKDYNSDKDRDVIAAFYGSKKFVKVKSDAFRIGKVHFSFVETDDNDKAVRSQDFWLDMADAGLIAKDIIFGTIQKRAEAAIQSGDQKALYKALFQKMGGVPEGKAKRKDGKALARVLSVVPSKSKGCPVCLRLEAGAGHSNEKGLIVPDWWGSNKNAKEFDILVPLNNEGMTGYMHDGELDAFGIRLWMAIQAYFTAGYQQGELLTPSYTKEEKTEETVSVPVFLDDAKTMKVKLVSPVTPSSNDKNTLYVTAAVSDSGKTVNLWMNKDEISYMDYLTRAASSGEEILVGYHIETDAAGKKFCWLAKA